MKVAGGAKTLEANGQFKIGERNYMMLRNLLWKNDVLIAGEDVGGTSSRTLMLRVGTVTLRTNGQIREL